MESLHGLPDNFACRGCSEPQRNIEDCTLLTEWIQKHPSKEDSADDGDDPDWTPEDRAPRDVFAGGGGGRHAAEEETVLLEGEDPSQRTAIRCAKSFVRTPQPDLRLESQLPARETRAARRS